MLFALGQGARFIEQPTSAVVTDSSTLSVETAKESVPYKVVETRDEYEIREYEEGRSPSSVHYHYTLDISAARARHHRADITCEMPLQETSPLQRHSDHLLQYHTRRCVLKSSAVG